MGIYADNAATTKICKSALDAMTECLTEIYGNPSSIHSVGQQAYHVMSDAREKIASLLNCRDDEIFFTSGGSESDNQAIRSAAIYGAENHKKHILSTAFEHHAVLHTLDSLKQDGFEITLLNVPSNGIVDPSQIEQAIRPDTCLVSVMYANNEIGTIQPAAEIGEICRKKGVIFHTDAVQAVGHLPINVREENIDLLSLSAHKFHGPKGIGALYCKKGIPLSNLIYGGAQEQGKRAGTENVPAIAGMAAALAECSAKMADNRRKTTALRNQLIRGLAQIPGAHLNGDPEIRLAGNVNYSFEGIDGESLLMILDRKGIAASSGSACTAGSIDPSHVLSAIGCSDEMAGSSLRLTIDEQNTEDEIRTIISAVTEAVSLLRTLQ